MELDNLVAVDNYDNPLEMDVLLFASLEKDFASYELVIDAVVAVGLVKLVNDKKTM